MISYYMIGYDMRENISNTTRASLFIVSVQDYIKDFKILVRFLVEM